MKPGDRDYYCRRVAEESAAAQAASCAQARGVHHELAERYSAKLRLIDALLRDDCFEEPRQARVHIRRAR